MSMEIKASEKCQKAIDSMVSEESKYLDKAIYLLDLGGGTQLNIKRVACLE